MGNKIIRPSQNCIYITCHILLFMDLFHVVSLKLGRLQVVSTLVGGVPEVLPPDLIRLAEPTVTGNDHTHTQLEGHSVM